MAREVRNKGASVRARLLQQARREKRDFNLLLQRYALERFLYRLSASRHRDRFILKGAMLFAAWTADPFRATRDIDLLGYGDPEAAQLAETFREICVVEAPDDGVTFDAGALRAEAIREDTEYGGIRIRTNAFIDRARLPIQVDVGFGDVVTPGAAEIKYPTLLDAPAPRLKAYPVETVVAEKFQALVALGMANSRMKDLYDLWVISRHFGFEANELGKAIRQTFERRQTAVPSDAPAGLSDAFSEEPDKEKQWQAFAKRGVTLEPPTSLYAVIGDIRDFLLPVCAADASGTWEPGGPWRP